MSSDLASVASVSASASESASSTPIVPDAPPVDPIFAHVVVVHARTILAEQRGTSVTLLIGALSKLVQTGKLELTGDADPGETLMEIIKNESTNLLDLRAETFPTNFPDHESFKSRLRPLHMRQVSNCLKHLQALKIACSLPGTINTPILPFSLIIEDDALFTAEVERQLRDVVKSIPEDADIVFISLPTPVQSQGEAPKPFLPIDGLFNGDLPACDAYIVRTSAAEKLSSSFLPIRLHTPAHLRYMISSLGLRAYVSTSNIFVDGSKIGIFPSSIEVNNILLWNPSYCRLLDTTSSPNITNDELKQALEMESKTQTFGKHPDVLALRSRCMARMGMFKEAKELAEQAMQGFEQGAALFNDNSIFLRNYMNIYVNLQEDTSS